MRNLKKVLSVVLVFALVLSLSVVGGAASFADVASDYQYKDAIDLLAALNVLGGFEDGTFKPEQDITRAQFSKILYVIFQGADDVDASIYKGESTFKDVAKTQWFSGHVNWAYNNAVVGGYGDGTFLPDNNVKLKEAIKMVVASATDKALTYPNGYIQEAKALGLLDDVVMSNPDDNATRGQIAQMAYNLLYTPSKLCQKDTGNLNSDGESIYKKVEPITFVFKLASVGKPDGDDNTDDNKDNVVKTAVEFVGSYDNAFVYDTSNELEEGQIVLSTYSVEDDTTGKTGDQDLYPQYEAIDEDMIFEYDGDVSDLYGQQVTVYFKESTKGNPSLDEKDEIFSIIPNGTILDSTISGLTGTNGKFKVDGVQINLPKAIDVSGTKVYAFEKAFIQDGVVNVPYNGDYNVTPTTAVEDLDYSDFFASTSVKKDDLVRLIDVNSDGVYDRIIESVVVNGAKVLTYSTSAKSLTLDTMIGATKIFGFDVVDGEENIAKEDIVNVVPTLKGDGKTYIKVTKADSATGKLTSVPTNGLTAVIDGKTYTSGYNKTADKGFFADRADLINEDVTVYFDTLGYVVKIVESDDSVDSGLNLAYVKNATDNADKYGNNVTASLELVLPDGTVKTVNVDIDRTKAGDLKDLKLAETSVDWVRTTAPTNNTDDIFWVYNPAKVDEDGETYGEAEIIGNYIHYEIDSKTNLVNKIVMVADLDKSEATKPTRVSSDAIDWEVKSYTDVLCYNNTIKGFYTLSNDVENIVAFPSSDIVGMSYQLDRDTNVVTANYYTASTMPQFEEEGSYLLIVADGKVVAFVVTDDGIASDGDVVVGLITSYGMVPGAALGADGDNTYRNMIEMWVNGETKTYYTDDVSTVAELINAEEEANKLTTKQLVRLTLDTNGKVQTHEVDEGTAPNTVKRIAAKLEYLHLNDFKYAVATESTGNYFNLKNVNAITNSIEKGLNWVEVIEDGVSKWKLIEVKDTTFGSISYASGSKFYGTVAETQILSYDGELVNFDLSKDATAKFQQISALTNNAEVPVTTIDLVNGYNGSVIAYTVFGESDGNGETYTDDDDLYGKLAMVIVFTNDIIVDAAD